MTNGSDDRKFDCAPMPEVLDAVFSEEHMPGLAEDVRERAKETVTNWEGSNPEEAMTCIATDDYPLVTRQMQKEVERGYIVADKPASKMGIYGANNRHEKRVEGFFRGLNRHCDECLRTECETRSRLTRQQIAELARSSATYTNSRRSKATKKRRFPVVEDSESNYDYA